MTKSVSNTFAASIKGAINTWFLFVAFENKVAFFVFIFRENKIKKFCYTLLANLLLRQICLQMRILGTEDECSKTPNAIQYSQYLIQTIDSCWH